MNIVLNFEIVTSSVCLIKAFEVEIIAEKKMVERDCSKHSTLRFLSNNKV